MSDETGLAITQAQSDKSAIDTDQPQPPPTATFDARGVVTADARRELPDVPGFQILEEIGRGGMGVVLRARDLELDRDVAVKVLRQAGDGASDLARGLWKRPTSAASCSTLVSRPSIAWESSPTKVPFLP
jgi:serine/threonine protein kinase